MADILKHRLLGLNQEDHWLYKDLYTFMEEKGMVTPAPLDLPRLQRHWPAFESQRDALLRLRKDIVAEIESSCRPKYSCSVGPDSEGLVFYVFLEKTRKRKLARRMKSDYLWVAGGVEPDEDEIYAYAGMGWTKNGGDRIPDRVSEFLKSKGFEEDHNSYGGYECEGYYRSKSLTQLVGSSAGFAAQSKRICRWMKEQISLTLKGFNKIEKHW